VFVADQATYYHKLIHVIMLIFSEDDLKLKLQRAAAKHGLEEKVSLKLVYQNRYTFSKLNNLKLKAMNSIITKSLTSQLRQQMSGVCMPCVFCVLEKTPIARYSFAVGFSCTLNQVEQLIESVDQVVDKLKEGEVSDDDLELFYTEELHHIALLLKQRSAMRFLGSLHDDETLESFFGLYLNRQSRLKKNDLAATANLFLDKSNLKQFLFLSAQN
jgi:hypothetical protein